MKKYLFSLFCAALASAAWAEGPVLVVPSPVAGTVLPVSTNAAARAVTVAVPVATGAHCKACNDCCPKTKTVCVSQPTTVVKTKVLFSSGCETLCHKAICQKKGDGCCESCQEGTCGKAYVHRDLYKKVCKEECPSFKCVPTQVQCEPKCAPKCATPCVSGACGATNVTTVIQTAAPVVPETNAVTQAQAVNVNPVQEPIPTATPMGVRPTLVP